MGFSAASARFDQALTVTEGSFGDLLSKFRLLVPAFEDEPLPKIWPQGYFATLKIYSLNNFAAT